MTNIIRSDLFRLRKGRAVQITLLGLAAFIVLIGVTLAAMGDQGVQDYLVSQVPQEESTDLTSNFEMMDEIMPTNAVEFVWEMLSESFLPLFLLPVIVAVFCADFSSFTYRNTFSYRTGRGGVYLAKLVTSILVMLMMTGAMIVFSFLLGGVLFGFGGFGAEGVLRILTTVVLQLPMNLVCICFGHCLVAFTRKSGPTIAAYLLTLIFLSVAVQLLSLALPALSPYITLLDWQSAGKLVAEYWTAPVGLVVFAEVSSLAVAGAATALGLIRLQKSDLH